MLSEKFYMNQIRIFTLYPNPTNTDYVIFSSIPPSSLTPAAS